MNLDYTKYIHPTFSLNGEKLDFFSLKNKVPELLHSNQEHLVNLGNFIEQWFSDAKSISITTSGTTGAPKLIDIEKQAVVASAFATANHFKIVNNASALHCLPIQYIAGKLMFVRAILLGWNLVYVKPTSNPLQSLNTNFDFVAMVPLQVENSLDKMHLVKQVIIGGAKLNATLKQKLFGFDTEFFETYGMTETVTHIAAKKIEEDAFSALPNVFFETDNRDCLVINAPRVSKNKIITNDVVELLNANQFIWKGRADNVINSGGVKLFPEKIEAKLDKIITNRFFVAGVEDDILGKKLVLIIEGNPREINFKTIADLQKFETPKKVFFVDTFLETETGKIKRKEILKSLNLI